MMAVFASNNKEVVQIRVQLLVWRQCLHGLSLDQALQPANDTKDQQLDIYLAT